MAMSDRTIIPNLSPIESVRCLECGTVYSKPAGGGTASRNPGCPDCGYVGWRAVTVPFRESSRHHFAADRQRRRSA